MPKLYFASPRDLPIAHPQPGVTERALKAQATSLLITDLDAKTVVDTHKHDDERLGIVTRGSIAMAIAGETRILTEGDTFVVPAGAAHGVRVLEQGAQVVEVRSQRPD